MTDSIFISLLGRIVLFLDPSGSLYSIFVPAAKLLHELPHSRDAEIEADHIGIYLAADACYDPNAAKRVFTSMKDGEGGSSEYISTHPSYDRR